MWPVESRISGRSLGALLVVVLMVGTACAQSAQSDAGYKKHARKVQPGTVQTADLHKLFPLYFMENRAGVPDATPFVCLRHWASMFLTSNGPVVELLTTYDEVTMEPMLRVSFEGAGPSVPTAGDPVALFNYYRGRVSSGWYEEVPAYDTVFYKDVYAGIDLAVKGNQPDCLYAFALGTGVSTDNIKFRVDGSSAVLSIEPWGLRINGDFDEIDEYLPVAYQMTPSGRVDLATAFKLFEPTLYGFDIAGIDPSLPLYIEHEPALPGFLARGTFPWHCGYVAKGLDTDVVIAGTASGYDIPFIGDPYAPRWCPSQLGFFSARLTSGGQLKWCTILDGLTEDEGWEADDYCAAVAIGCDRSVWLTGASQSNDFPMLDAFCDQHHGTNSGDVVVSRLNERGLLRFSSYLGGSSSEAAYDIDVDKHGDAWITGFSDSWDFPTPNSNAPHPPNRSRAVIVSKVTKQGILAWGYCFGAGSFSSGQGIAVDRALNAWVTGSTRSAELPDAGRL